LNSTGEIIDARKGTSGRTLKYELSDKEKLERAEAKIKLLEVESELLKNIIFNNLCLEEAIVGIIHHKNLILDIWKMN